MKLDRRDLGASDQPFNVIDLEIGLAITRDGHEVERGDLPSMA